MRYNRDTFNRSPMRIMQGPSLKIGQNKDKEDEHPAMESFSNRENSTGELGIESEIFWSLRK